MGVAQEVEQTVSRVPIWGWGALAGGAVLIMLARHSAAAAAVVDPNTATPDTGALPGQVYPPAGYVPPVTPGTTPDPGGSVIPPPSVQKFTDILGGTIQSFVAGLPVAPNLLTFQDASGNQFTESNNENALFYHAQETNSTNFFNALMAWIQANPGAPNPFQTIFPALPGVTTPAQATSPTYSLGNYGTTPPGYSLGNYGTTPAAGGASGGLASVAAAIRAHCHPGDTQCALAVAPTWDGSPIAGWV